MTAHQFRTDERPSMVPTSTDATNLWKQTRERKGLFIHLGEVSARLRGKDPKNISNSDLRWGGIFLLVGATALIFAGTQILDVLTLAPAQ